MVGVGPTDQYHYVERDINSISYAQTSSSAFCPDGLNLGSAQASSTKSDDEKW